MAVQVSVETLDHLVVRAADVERTMAWYGEVLGLQPERLEEWRRGEAFFPSLRVDATTIIDVLPGLPDAANTPERLDHLCFVVTGADLDAVAADPDLDVVEGPVTRWGARGNGTSVYVRDPDGLLVELRTYPD